MYIKRDKKKNGRIYLSIAQSYRNSQGVQRNRIVRSLGYMDELEKEWNEDVMEKCKEICIEMTKAYKEQNDPITLTINPKEKLDKHTSYRKCVGIAVPMSFYNELGIETTIRNACSNRKHKFDVNAVMRLLVADRLFDSSSKKSAWENKDKWFFRSAFTKTDMYRALDVLAENKNKIISAMNRKIASVGVRDIKAVFYDVTNYYFEIDKEDDLRRRGVSKEHRKARLCRWGFYRTHMEFRCPINSSLETHKIVPLC